MQKGQTNHKDMDAAFTLVELLVVIVIISVLAALAFPVFGVVRRNAQRASCMSNLRQIHTALSLYIQDADGMYPYAINPADRAHPERWEDYPDFMASIPRLPQFHEVIIPYTKSREVFHCPSDFGLKIPEPFPGWRLEASTSSYDVFGTSYFYQTMLVLLQASDARVTIPADTLVLMDADGKWHGSASEPELAHVMRRYNLLFADGHVRNLTHGQLGKFWNPPL